MRHNVLGLITLLLSCIVVSQLSATNHTLRPIKDISKERQFDNSSVTTALRENITTTNCSTSNSMNSVNSAPPTKAENCTQNVRYSAKSKKLKKRREESENSRDMNDTNQVDHQQQQQTLNQHSTTESNPSLRKKRRRIISTRVVEPVVTTKSVLSEYVPPTDMEMQISYSDFGRKISRPTKYSAKLEDDITIETNHAPERLQMASTNLANYYRKMSSKSSSTPTLCNIRARRWNGTACSKPAEQTTAKAEAANKTNVNAKIKHLIKHRNKSSELAAEDNSALNKYKSHALSENNVVSKRLDGAKNNASSITSERLTTDLKNTTEYNNYSSPFSRISESTEKATALGLKYGARNSTDGYANPSYLIAANKLAEGSTSVEQIIRAQSSTNSYGNGNASTVGPSRSIAVVTSTSVIDSKSTSKQDHVYNSSGVLFSILEEQKSINSTLRPSLILYQRTPAKYNRNRNIHFSKVLTPQMKPTTTSTTTIEPSTVDGTTPPFALVATLVSPVYTKASTILINVQTEANTDDVASDEDSKTTTAVEEQLVVTTDMNISLDAASTEETLFVSTEDRFLQKISTATTSSASLNDTLTFFSKNTLNSHTTTENFDDNYQSGFHIITYALAALAIIPLLIGIVLVTKMIFNHNNKQIFEGSEYSSEYNRNPLEFHGGVTSSPVATKLPRLSHQTCQWEIERKTYSALCIPNTGKWEFPREKLRLQTILGQGNFGQVWKAEADDISEHEGLTRLVAVKMVKEISSAREKEDLIKELLIMQHLGTHPNVVTLLGCCTDQEPYMLIMEYVMYGKLLSFLRDYRTRSHYFNFSDNGDSLTSRDLTVFGYCVARGMDYLQSKQIIHRDLAARNILVDHNKLCKIADFGMSREVGESGQVQEHRQSKGALPIRWMAPESLQHSVYTHKTDVWSFGILMWEIITLGSMPYATMGARVVMRKVKEGYRLEKPKYCKSQLFNVISKCWSLEANERPSFADLKHELASLLDDPQHKGDLVDLEMLAMETERQAVHDVAAATVAAAAAVQRENILH